MARRVNSAGPSLISGHNLRFPFSGAPLKVGGVRGVMNKQQKETRNTYNRSYPPYFKGDVAKENPYLSGDS
jgi:hypothetical protein